MIDLAALADDELGAEHTARANEAVVLRRQFRGDPADTSVGAALAAARDRARETQAELNRRFGAPAAQTIQG